jgi:hypothetical protein
MHNSIVIYLGVIFDKRITWRLHIEMTKTEAFRAFIRIYSLIKSEHLSTNIKLTLHKALIRSVMTYACTAWKFSADTHLLKLWGSPRHWKFSKVHTSPRFADWFQPSICVWLYNKIVQATSRGHIKSWERLCSQPFKWLSCHCSIR